MAKATGKEKVKATDTGDDAANAPDFTGDGDTGDASGDDNSGGTAAPMVMVKALVRISGPGYVVEENETEPIPVIYAKSHEADGTAEIQGKVIGND